MGGKESDDFDSIVSGLQSNRIEFKKKKKKAVQGCCPKQGRVTFNE